MVARLWAALSFAHCCAKMKIKVLTILNRDRLKFGGVGYLHGAKHKQEAASGPSAVRSFTSRVLAILCLVGMQTQR